MTRDGLPQRVASLYKPAACEQEGRGRFWQAAGGAQRGVDRLDASQEGVEADVSAPQLGEDAALLAGEPLVQLRDRRPRGGVADVPRETRALRGGPPGVGPLGQGALLEPPLEDSPAGTQAPELPENGGQEVRGLLAPGRAGCLIAGALHGHMVPRGMPPVATHSAPRRGSSDII